MRRHLWRNYLSLALLAICPAVCLGGWLEHQCATTPIHADNGPTDCTGHTCLCTGAAVHPVPAPLLPPPPLPALFANEPDSPLLGGTGPILGHDFDGPPPDQPRANGSAPLLI